MLNPYVAPQLEFDSDDEPDDPTFHDDWVHHVSRPDPSEAHLVPPDPLSEDELMSYEVPLPEGPAIAGTVIRGRLRARYNAWREISANGQVLNWIRHGYRIPFEGVPPPPYRCGRNHAGADTHRTWLEGAIRELVAVGAARRWTGAQPPRWVSPLNVVPKATAGKFRLILDLRYVK